MSIVVHMPKSRETEENVLKIKKAGEEEKQRERQSGKSLEPVFILNALKLGLPNWALECGG